jgi:hypothetical protein
MGHRTYLVDDETGTLSAACKDCDAFKMTAPASEGDSIATLTEAAQLHEAETQEQEDDEPAACRLARSVDVLMEVAAVSQNWNWETVHRETGDGFIISVIVEELPDPGTT